MFFEQITKIFLRFFFFFLFLIRFVFHILSLLLGAHLMMLSTLKIISAASEAEINACSLHLKLSCLVL